MDSNPEQLEQDKSQSHDQPIKNDNSAFWAAVLIPLIGGSCLLACYLAATILISLAI